MPAPTTTSHPPPAGGTRRSRRGARSSFWLTLAILTACATPLPHPAAQPLPPAQPAPAATPPPQPEERAPTAQAPPPTLADVFYFAHNFGGVCYVEVGLEPMRDRLLATPASRTGETRLIRSDTEAFVVEAALTEETGRQVLDAAEGAAEFKVLRADDLVVSGPLGPPVLITRVIPHFSVRKAWDEEGVDPYAPESEDARHALLELGEAVLMAPVQSADGRCFSDAALWATPMEGPFADVARFEHADGRQDRAVGEKSRQLAAWVDARNRVARAYREHGNLPAPEVKLTIFRAPLHALREAAAWTWGETLWFVWLQTGTAFCGEGPDEASLYLLWAQSQPEVPLLLRTDTFEPLLLSDFDHDGFPDFVARTSIIDEEITLFTFRNGRLERIKSTRLSYNDTPC